MIQQRLFLMHFVSKQESQSLEKTVSCTLNEEKLEAHIPCCKPLISKKNQKVHLDFVTEHILWTEEQWNMVHFSDESKFNLFGSDRKRFVRPKNGRSLSPQWIKKTVKFGGGSEISSNSIPTTYVSIQIDLKTTIKQHVQQS